MYKSFRCSILFGICAVAFSQPVLRIKVHADSLGGDAREDPVNRARRLPPNVRTHVIVQFDQPATPETLAELTARGAVVLQDVPDFGVLVSTNGMVPLEDLGIRRAGRLDPREKVSPMITKGDRSSAGSYYIVEFHPDVDSNSARRLILNSSIELSEHPDLAPHHLMVHLWNPNQAAETLAVLAAQDGVAYIFPASEDLATGRRAIAFAGALSALGPVGQYVATNGDGWDGPGQNATTLNYILNKMTEKLPTGAPQAEILRAMAEWSKVIQLDWQAGAGSLGNHTVNILFAQGAHGDSYPFDGAGGVLAHTFYPAPLNPEPIAGDMHCDDSEDWGVGINFDLFSIVLHELGHALGLGHSDNPNAVMYPYYKMVSGLAEDDKTAILTLYAARTGTIPPAPDPLTLTVNIPAGTTTASTLSLSGTVASGNGATAVAWSNNGASGTAFVVGTSWTAPGIALAIGLNSITVTATDPAGSVSRLVSTTRQPVAPPPTPPQPPPPSPQPPAGKDNTAPSLTISYPSATSFSTTLSSLMFRGTASDSSGVSTVTWATNTGGAGAASGTTQWTAAVPLLVGSNQVIIRATDAAGNLSWRSVIVTRR